MEKKLSERIKDFRNGKDLIDWEDLILNVKDLEKQLEDEKEKHAETTRAYTPTYKENQRLKEFLRECYSYLPEHFLGQYNQLLNPKNNETK